MSEQPSTGRYSARVIRELVDKHFSLEWCRENVVIQLKHIKSREFNEKCILVASYLATIGNFIKLRLKHCQFIEKEAHEIQELLEKASNYKLIHKNPESLALTEGSILDDLRSDNKDNQDESYEFSFEDEDEDEIEIEEEDAGLDRHQAPCCLVLH